MSDKRNNIPEEYQIILDMDWKQYFTEEELEMIDCIGLENFLKALKRFRRQTFYFTEDRVLQMKKDFVRKNQNNISKKKLARETGFSERTIYNIISPSDDSQISIFDKE